jgi:hypothetical protein
LGNLYVDFACYVNLPTSIRAGKAYKNQEIAYFIRLFLGMELQIPRKKRINFGFSPILYASFFHNPMLCQPINPKQAYKKTNFLIFIRSERQRPSLKGENTGHPSQKR